MTSAKPTVGRLERWRPRNWSLALKLAAVLLVPTVLGVSLGVARIVEHIHEANDLASVDRFVGLERQVSTVIGQLQQERDQASVFVQNNRTGDADALRTLFGTTDDQINALSNAMNDPATAGGAARTAFGQLRDNLDRLAQLRDQVTGNGIQAPAVIAQYTGLIRPAVVLEAAVNRQLNTPALAGFATALTALTSAREQIALEHSVIGVAIARGEMLPPDADTVHGADAQLSAAVDQFRAALTADQQNRFAGFVDSPGANQRQQLKQTALSRVGPKGQLGIAPTDWDRVSGSALEELRTSADGLRGELSSTSAGQQESARNAAGVDSVILLLALLAGAAVLFLVGRSMIKPLRVLRASALDVADRRLPKAVADMRAGDTVDTAVEPVPVYTHEEIGQVARAFDEVHGQAVRLAAEQATLQTNVSNMFVNLSRRSQGLVERQLRLIEQLERNEQDAEQLDNLFQLDHLATRMRRNSENLLVLAGSELGKRGGAPVPVVDVLRAAVSEIEQYQRVVVQQPPQASITGRAASDMVHLVAELLDNATAFSPPDSQVVISSTLTSAGGVLVEIADQGVGMPGQELIAANNRLAEPSEVDVSASRRMGLFVVGRLGTKHGVHVRLAGSDQSRAATGGVTASVWVPAALIAAVGAPGRPGAPADLATGVTRAGVQAPVGSRGGDALVNGAGLNGFGVPSAEPAGRRDGATPPSGPGLDAAGAAGTAAAAGAVGSAGADARATGATRAASELPRRSPGELSRRGDSDPARRPAGDEADDPARRATGGEPDRLPRRSAGASLGDGPGGPGSRPAARRPDARAGATPAGAGEIGGDPVGADGGPGGPGTANGFSGSNATRGTHGLRPAPGDARPESDGPGADQLRPPAERPTAGGRRLPQRPYLRGSRPPGEAPPPPPPGLEPAVEAPATGAHSLNEIAPDLTGPQPVVDGPRHEPTEESRPPQRWPADQRPGPASDRFPAGPPPARRSAPEPPSRERRPAGPVTPRRPRNPSDLPVAGAEGATAAAAGGSDGEARPPGSESPIFEEMASAWFRENREPDLPAEQPDVPSAQAGPVPAAERASAHSGGRGDGQPEGGWDSGEPLLRPMPDDAEPAELTTAGLPRRRPRSQLIPGGSSEQNGVPPAVFPARSAEQVRGRLASYQQGVRQGRESRHRRAEPDTANAGARQGRQGQHDYEEETP
jgi:signal transduction histidine kinase